VRYDEVHVYDACTSVAGISAQLCMYSTEMIIKRWKTLKISRSLKQVGQCRLTQCLPHVQTELHWGRLRTDHRNLNSF